MNLTILGWNGVLQQHLVSWREHMFPHAIPARIASVNKRQYLVYTEEGELTATVSGRFRHATQEVRDYPTTGDWVLGDVDSYTDTVVIQKLLPRTNAFVRKAPISGGRGLGTIGGREQIVGGATIEQVVAANIDTTFCVTALDQNFNLNRIERYLLLGLASGTKPVIVLNKADYGGNIDAKVAAVRAIAQGAPLHVVSALTQTGIDLLQTYLHPGKTVALVGSSGVGKSTLINCLLGTSQLTVGAVRSSDSKGRHTTTRRELIMLPQGGMLIDTPGMREVQLWVDDDAVRMLFADIEALVQRCRFPNCRHTTDAGCAVVAALASGQLDRERYEHFLRLQAEVAYLASRKKGQPRRNYLRSTDHDE